MPRNPLKGVMKFVSPNIGSEHRMFMERLSDIEDNLIRKRGFDPSNFRQTAGRKEIDRLKQEARKIALRGSRPSIED